MAEHDSHRKWISSTGGPLIMMGKDSLANWSGVFGSNDSDNNQESSDYERACEVDDYVGVINVGLEQAIVLGDLPSQTTVIKSTSDEIVLARWIWAENEDDANTALEYLPINTEFEGTGINISIKDTRLVLFDSSASGIGLEEFIEIDVVKGDYEILTRSYEPDDKTNFFLVLLQKR